MFSCEWGGFIVSTGGGLCGVGFVSVCVGPGVSSMVGMLRACAVGDDGLHALHWYMLSCLCCCADGSRCLVVVCILRGDIGGLFLCLESFSVVRVVGVGVCGGGVIIVSGFFLR